MLPVVVILLGVLLGMVAFAIDVGVIAHARTELQAAADAGALAGIGELYSSSGTTQNFTAARVEVNKYVGGSAANQPGMVVADEDIQFAYYDPTAAAGSRFSTDLTGRSANALRVVLRRDGTTNPRLPLFFAQALGRQESTVQAQATAYVPPAQGVMVNAELIPFVAQIDYFNAAAGLTARSSTASGYVNVLASQFTDLWSVGTPGSTPVIGSDGVKELVLFTTHTVPGNFGSIDLGSESNGTPELARQLRYGPNAGDFAIMQAHGKLAADGTLQVPVNLTGDTGISNGTKDDWAAIVGLNRIIPLYDTVTDNGNNATYHLVAFAGVRVVAADMQGNPKRVWVQPTSFYSSKVSAASTGSGGMIGVYAPPRLIIP